MKNPLAEVLPQRFFRNRPQYGLRAMREIENEMERWLQPLSFDWGKEYDSFYFSPVCDFKENSKEYYLKLEIPGIKKEDVKIELENNLLTISGEKKKNVEEKDDRYFLSESYSGSFMRTFHLPNSVKEEDIDAHYEDGILSIKIPKIASSKAKQIKVH